jgi:hypothetical protein
MKLSELTSSINEAIPLAVAALARGAIPAAIKYGKKGYQTYKKSKAAPAAPKTGTTTRTRAAPAQQKPEASKGNIIKRYPKTAGAVGTGYLGYDIAKMGDDDYLDIGGVAGRAYDRAKNLVYDPRRSADKPSNQESPAAAPQPTPEPEQPKFKPTYNLDLLKNESLDLISSILKLSGQRAITERDNTVGIIKPKQIKTLTESAQIAECGGMMPNSSTSSQPATLNISATASSGDEVANMLKSIMQLAGVKPVEPSMMPQGEILPTVKPTQILGKTLEQRLAEIESSTNSTEDFDEGLGRELGDTPRDNMIKRLSPTIMDEETLMKKVAKVINSPEFTSDTVLKIVDAGSSITHPVGKFLQKEFEELQYDLGRKYEDMPEEVAEQLIVQLRQRTQGSVEEGACGDCGGNPCECAMEETYDNTPEERVEPYDPNNMAHVINKVSSKELASTPYQSASNPLSEAPVETKKVDEDVYHGLFKAYQEFKNSQ